MRRIQIQNKTDNKSFSIKLNSNNQTFKTPISKVDNSVKVKVTTKTDKADSTSINTSSNLKIWFSSNSLI